MSISLSLKCERRLRLWKGHMKPQWKMRLMQFNNFNFMYLTSQFIGNCVLLFEITVDQALSLYSAESINQGTNVKHLSAFK